jgi:hypothetical protein
MILRVNLAATPAAVTLEDPQDCGRFHVSATGGSDTGHLATVLAVAGVGGAVSGDTDHVWVSVESVRTLAAGRVDPAWSDEFGQMLSFASTKGWLDQGGTSIQAHVEWAP